jgi:dipeptidase E
MELLLLSSSRTPAGYLTDYLADIKAFTAGIDRALFLPFAAVSLPWEEYRLKVGEALAPAGVTLELIRSLDDLMQSELIIVGGGNTFQLLRECRMRGLLAAIQEKVKSGARYRAGSTRSG